MPEPLKIQFRPGINRETTDYGNTGGWYDGNLVRWISKTPCSMGGWQRFTADQAQGTFRSLFPFSTLNGTRFYGAGTNLKYYLVYGNSLVDITPIRKTVNPMANNPFETGTAGSTTITVTDVGNGSVMNDFVTFSGATGPIDGIPADEFNAEHQITSIIDADTYTIEVTTPAVAGSTSGGGAAVIAAYQINVGLDTSALGNGWGTGGWGVNPWGEGSADFVDTDQLRLWSEDNFGEDLLINPRNGGVYYKDMGSVSTRAVNITSLSGAHNAPIIARQVLVSDNDRHVVVFGTNTLGTSVQDPLLIRWSDTESVTEWTPDTTNTAGSLSINLGSEFLRAVETTTEILIFTDVGLHSFRFIGPPYTFGQTRIASNIQLIGPNAAATTGSITAWMATGPVFQYYDGVVHDLPCDIRTYIASILNTEQSEKIYAGVNRQFHEFIWLMPVNGSNQNNFYVICNYENPADPLWYYGSFNNAGRSTWLDAWFESTPLAGSADGYIYAHESGATDQSVTPATMLDSYLKSSVFELGNGSDFMLVSRTIPDVDFTGSTTSTAEATITFEKRDYPGSEFVAGPNNVIDLTVTGPPAQYTGKIDRRFRARSVQFGIEASSIGTLWQLGVPRLYASPDGQR